MRADFKHITDVAIGDRLVGGIVTSIRTSKSGKSIWFTMKGRTGEKEWPRESADIRTAVFTDPEVVGVRADWWAVETGSPVESVIAPASRFEGADGKPTGEDPYELARYLSAGLDDGACDFSPDTGGHTIVRDAVSGKVLARYRGGVAVTAAAEAAAPTQANGQQPEACKYEDVPGDPAIRVCVTHDRDFGLYGGEFCAHDKP